ncbi:MAG: precorrin-4 C(11)-methyltransferase [Proteobacteria bacterium]|nr:precorrin-4 C(11)-methyltransferase [Pseudomonadota bacterium]
MEKKCPVSFIGAGPGDPELITVKGQKRISEADLILYAGSLVPKELITDVKGSAKIIDSSGMTLDETHLMILETVRNGGTVARVHTGDPSLYGAIKEQILLLDKDGIAFEIIPGVTVAFAAAAAAKISFTLPEAVQTLIFTRLGGRTPVPETQRLKYLAKHMASIAVYLSSENPEKMVEELIDGGYPNDTPVIIAHRVGWPDERIISTRLESVVSETKNAEIKRQAVFLILPGQDKESAFSKLYDPKFSHGFRK